MYENQNLDSVAVDFSLGGDIACAEANDPAKDPDSSRMIPLIYDSLYFDSAWTNPGFSANASNQFGYYIQQKNKSISAKMVSYANMKSFVNEIKKLHLNIKIGNSR
ncbi:MAG: hypothetical protein IKJ35_05700 [Clostridia bacterium]|nr:hypothetical protein [Clostridia bacterium]